MEEKLQGFACGSAHPHGPFLGPLTLRPSLPEIDAAFLQELWIAGRFVVADGGPVDRFRRRIRLGMTGGNHLKGGFSRTKLATTEVGLGQSQMQLSQEIVGGQKTDHAMPLRAVRFCQNQCRCPLRLEAAKILGSLLDVYLHGNEVLDDGLRNLFLRIYLGVQPSASASHRRRAEVEQHHLSRCVGLLQSLIRIL